MKPKPKRLRRFYENQAAFRLEDVFNHGKIMEAQGYQRGLKVGIEERNELELKLENAHRMLDIWKHR